MYYFGDVVNTIVAVVVVILMMRVSRLRSALSRLEAEVARLREMPREEGAPSQVDATPAQQASPWNAAKSPDSAPPVTSEPAAATANVKHAEPPKDAAPSAPEEPKGPPRAVVFTAARMEALSQWLKANWIYVVSAVSLAFAGLFLLQYGIETGLLSPRLRVMSGLAFGVALITGGEYIRRRWGDRDDDTTAFLPSVFSGAGLVVLFGVVLAALNLYQLISPPMALVGLIVVSVVATVLGWFTGPLMAALGLIGSFVAPFVVGGSSDAPELFFGYFAIVALVGLAVDAARRWAWVSVLALALLSAAATLLFLRIGHPVHYAITMVGMVLATMAVPPVRLFPDHGGPGLVDMIRAGRKGPFAEFPTRLVMGALIVATGALLLVAGEGGDGMWISAVGFAVLFAAIALWAHKATALEDLAVLPALGFVAAPFIEAGQFGPRFSAFIRAGQAIEEIAVPTDVYWLMAIAVALTLTASYRSRSGARWRTGWAAGAALIAPVTFAVLEVFWMPAEVFGAYPWGLVAIAIAALMTALAVRVAPHDGARRPRVSAYALAAISMISFALMVLLTDAALTLALAVTTAAAAALDKRFGLRPVAVFVQVGAILVAGRLLIYPGLFWAWFDAGYVQLAVAYAGSAAALAYAWHLYRNMERTNAVAVLESAAWSVGAVFVAVLLARGISDISGEDSLLTHWGFGLMATVWCVAAAAQLYRYRLGGPLGTLRATLAGIYGAIAAILTIGAASHLNPALDGGSTNAVLGWPVFNSLIVAYLMPALIIGYVARRFIWVPPLVRRGFMVSSLGLGALWLFLVIRHFWRGAEMAQEGFTDPELYSYTIALLVIGAGLLWQAIARRDANLRKAGMAVIAVTVAKVFLVDMSGLVGLLRALSFLVLGLALAGLAFLNRWSVRLTDSDGATDEATADGSSDDGADSDETDGEDDR